MFSISRFWCILPAKGLCLPSGPSERATTMRFSPFLSRIRFAMGLAVCEQFSRARGLLSMDSPSPLTQEFSELVGNFLGAVLETGAQNTRK